jgi:hypothetical protein
VVTQGDEIVAAIGALERFAESAGLTSRIAELEHQLRGANGHSIAQLLANQGVEARMLDGALVLKRLAGQVNVAVHSLGILLALPTILEEGEVIDELSLGAGNTGRSFDLATNLRIAEFKFIAWRGGAEAIRQNSLFVDLYHLAEADTDRRRQLYVTDLVHPMRFLQCRRALKSVLTKHGTVAEEFFSRFGDRYVVVRDYWDDVKDRVEVIDISKLVPAFSRLPIEGDEAASAVELHRVIP